MEEYSFKLGKAFSSEQLERWLEKLKGLEKIICYQKVFDNYVIKTENPALIRAMPRLQERGYIGDLEKLGEVSIPKNEEFRILDV